MHEIQAVIATERDAVAICRAWPGASRIKGESGWWLVPLHQAMVGRLTGRELVFPDLEDPLEAVRLPEAVAPLIEALRRVPLTDPVAVVLTQYWGGEGAQAAVVLSRGRVTLGPSVAQGVINQALLELGVQPQAGRDPFDTVGLGRWRSMDDFGKGEAG